MKRNELINFELKQYQRDFLARVLKDAKAKRRLARKAAIKSVRRNR